MKRFKVSELKKTSAEYWILESIKKDMLTYDNPLKYQNYWICHSDGLSREIFMFCHEDYDGACDANDDRSGFGYSIEDCIHKINEYILENEVDNS